mmetsp:Transcript_34215/g.82729  ORF Transcript_34215/g.82729 Transcript_34215/m.82729 type:complete len:209 (-) Transcript_34215:390-1016(-)
MQRNDPSALPPQLQPHRSRRLIQRRLRHSIAIPSAQLVVGYGTHARAQVDDDRGGSVGGKRYFDLLLIAIIFLSLDTAYLRQDVHFDRTSTRRAHQRTQRLRQHARAHDVHRQGLRHPIAFDIRQRSLRTRRRFAAVAKYSRHVEEGIHPSVSLRDSRRERIDGGLVLHVEGHDSDAIFWVSGGNLVQFAGRGRRSTARDERSLGPVQ